MMTLSAGKQGGKVAQTPMSLRNATAIPKSKSTEGLDRLGQGTRNSTAQPTLQGKRPTNTAQIVTAPHNQKQVSRLELLLAQKKERHSFSSTESSVDSQSVNKAIKQSALWTDVQKAVSHTGSMSPVNAAFAIHRLGCLNCFASRKRQADLAASGLVTSLLNTAVSDLAAIDAGSLVLILDGCARLKHAAPVPPSLLDSLATAAQRLAPTFGSAQLPLVLWAFSSLAFSPPVSLLFALSEAVPQRVGGFTPQGVCLTLGGFQTFHHKPSQHVMNCLAETLHRMLPLFTRSEVASCLEAFSSLGYQPPDHVIAAISDSAGQALHADATSGKARLSTPYVQFNMPGGEKGSSQILAAPTNKKHQANGTAGPRQMPHANHRQPGHKQLAYP